MRTWLPIVATLVALFAAPGDASAWGFVGHRLIMARAIELLPPALQPFFQKNKDELILRVVDPDVWRNAGWDDEPNHFVDFGMPELGPPPFDALPHDYSAALAKFGQAQMKRIGTLPWRDEEMAGNLRRAFGGFAKDSPYVSGDVVLFSAVASHYMQDANQPFHASNNYDGQLTGNNGIHSRFERDLIERFQSRLTLTPKAPTAINDVREYAFAMLMVSQGYVDNILAADRAAATGKDVYDDEYFEKFFTAVKPILEQRLSSAITATAGVIIGAWEAAGKPVLKLQDARPLQKVKR